MNADLRALSLADGADVHEMLQEIGPGEGGFQNDGYGIDLGDFPTFLRRNVDQSLGIGLAPHLVPRTVYWLFVDGRPVGFGKLRHHLNDYFRPYGHIGFCIRPSERRKGYGSVMLRELLGRAKGLGLDEVLLVCLEGNLPSRRVIEKNQGVLVELRDGKCSYSVRI